jgi:hypothetical protein|tara:strand:- start:318 stop:1286 length:969 start_codon:yes stop_codon:yes gene_type:complete
MNTLNYLGRLFATLPVNGLPFNTPKLKNDLFEAGGALVKELCHRVEVETFHAEKVSRQDKQLIKEARFYFHKVDEPLRLKPMALKDRHLYPEQLFSTDKASGDVKMKGNIYFPDMTMRETLERITLFYAHLLSFVGESSEVNIKVFSYDENTGDFDTEYGLHLHEKYINLIEQSVDKKVTACRDEFVNSFLKGFMPGMASKSVTELSPRMDLTSAPWDENELKNPLLDMLKCVSMEKRTVPFKKYLSHDERFELHIEKYLIEHFPIQPPFSKEEHGLDADTWDAFFSTGESFAYKSRYTSFLKEEIDKRKITLGDAIAIAGV